LPGKLNVYVKKMLCLWILAWLIFRPRSWRRLFLRNVGLFSTDHTAL
jgi:hypothetical protein